MSGSLWDSRYRVMVLSISFLLYSAWFQCSSNVHGEIVFVPIIFRMKHRTQTQ